MSEASDFIPLSVPRIQAKEWDYVKECLDSEWVSSVGPFVERFEREFAAYVGAKYAVACSSGSAALHVALQLAGVSAGDLVLVPTLTFIASVNAIRYCGAEPFFFDCDDFYNLDPEQVAAFIQRDCERKGEALLHKQSGRRVAAVLPVHVFGNAVNFGSLLELCEQYHLPLVEDAAESLGTRYRSHAGAKTRDKHSGTIGLMGCFSFNGNKIITTGGGGMLVTDNEELARRAKYITTQAKDDEVHFIHHEVGYNYRLTNVQAAIGVAQLEQLPLYCRKKQEIDAKYRRELEDVRGLKLSPQPPFAENNAWMPSLQVDPVLYGEDREQLLQRLSRKRIQARPLWELNHRQRPYLSCGRMQTNRAERLHELTLNIPCSIGLTPAQQDRVIRELRRES